MKFIIQKKWNVIYKDEYGIDDCEGYSMPENGTCICIDGYIREGGECVNGKK